MPDDLTTDYVATFRGDLDVISQLRSTPNAVRDYAVTSLQSLLDSETGLTNTARRQVTNAKQTLEHIADSSMADQFQTIYSQMCILAVSSLEALLKRYFERAATDIRNLDFDNKRLRELKVSIKDILFEEQRFGGKVGRLILEKDNQLNFQDLKAIKKAIETYFGRTISLSEGDEKVCCFYLEIRHVLVHRGGHIDRKFIQATSVLDANLMGYAEGDPVVLGDTDWDVMHDAFVNLVSAITARPATSDPDGRI